MKKIVLIIIILVAITIISGCYYQSAARTPSSEATAQGTETAMPSTTITPTATAIIKQGPTSIPTPDTTITPITEPDTTTAQESTTASEIPGSIVMPDPKAIFTLTKKDYEKLKAPLIVLAFTSEYSPDLNYDLKYGLSKDNIYHYAYNIADYFGYFYPTTGYSNIYNRDIEKYGIKKADLYIDDKGTNIPQKAINLILLSTFGEEALKEIDLNKNIFDDVYDYGPELKDGIYIFGPSDPPAIDDISIGPLNLPVKGNEDTEFTTSYTVTYTAVPPVIDDFSIVFKLKKDDTSEWGFNITAFSMQKVE